MTDAILISIGLSRDEATGEGLRRLSPQMNNYPTPLQKTSTAKPLEL